MLEHFVLDAVIGKRAGGVEAQRLQIPREDFHGGDAARLDRLDEFGAIGEGEGIIAPETEPLGIGEILDGRGARRRDIEDAGVGESVLEPQTRPALLGSLLVAALALAPRRVLHGVAFVEDDHAIEVGAEPVDDLAHARALIPARFRAKRRIGREENALLETDRRSRPEAGERRHQEPLLAEGGPIALGVLDQLVGFADPNRAPATLQPVVENDPGDLTALAGASAVAEKPAAAEADGIFSVIGGGGEIVEGVVDDPRALEMGGMSFAGIDHTLDLSVGEEA